MEYAKAINVDNKFIIYKATLNARELSDFINSNNDILFDDFPDKNSILWDEQVVIIYEWKTYKVQSINGYYFEENDFSGIGEYGTSSYGTLKIKNGMGYMTFLDKTIKVISSKISEEEFDKMVNIVNSYISNLSYDFNKATFSSIERVRNQKTDIDYHSFIYILNALTSKEISTNLIKAFSQIAMNPHRTETIEWEREDICSLSEYTSEMQSSILSGEFELELCGSSNSLSRKLSRGHKQYIPQYYIEEKYYDAYDNPENRFIKYFFQYCLSVLETFYNLLNSTESLINSNRKSLVTACINQIKNLLNTSFLRYVGKMNIIPTSSTVLTKKVGYRQIFAFFMGLRSMPKNTKIGESLKELIENKTLDVLYENYCYFTIADLLAVLYGESISQKSFKILTTNYNKTLEVQTYSNYFVYEATEILPKIILHYNKDYKRGETYSKNYDPDISLEIYDNDDNIQKIYCFDAKFKATAFDNDTDDEVVKLYKYDDISKMHAYKDAIKNAMGAYILYPGTIKTIFLEDEKSSNYRGVGAFCLRPGNDNDKSLISDTLFNMLQE